MHNDLLIAVQCLSWLLAFIVLLMHYARQTTCTSRVFMTLFELDIDKNEI